MHSNLDGYQTAEYEMWDTFALSAQEPQITEYKAPIDVGPWQ